MDGFKLPCGKCIGCLRNRAREWAIRCVHESKLHDESCFLTLTYAPEKLPANGSVDVREFQLFMKRLRKYAKKKLRYFECGEYGSRLGRPHYHALVFGFDFPDKRLHAVNGIGQKQYISPSLQQLWPFGFSIIGSVTDESAQYVARYTLKKIYGKNAREHYGEKKPEFVTMSRRPGIGYGWYQKFKGDIYPKGILVHNGVHQLPPKYYDTLFEKENPDAMEAIKRDRQCRAARVKAYDEVNGKTVPVSNNDCFRLPVREKIVQKRMRLLKRFMEDSN